MGLSRFGGLWTYGGVATQALDTTPTILSLWAHAADGPGVNADVAASSLTIKVPGYYAAYVSLTFSADAGQVVFAELRLNGSVGAGFRAAHEGIASGGVVNLFFMGAANMNANDQVSVYVYDDSDGTTLTLIDGQFGVISI